MNAMTRMVLVGLAYYATAKLGLMVAVVAGTVTLTWLPSGIGLAAMSWSVGKLWPAIFAAAFSANVSASTPAWFALGIATGNTLEAVAGAVLLHRLFGFHPSLGTVRDVFALLGAAAFAAVIGACFGVTTLTLAGLTAWHEDLRAWAIWWMGDTTGMLIGAPMILVWARPPDFPVSVFSWIEATVLLTALVGTAWSIFGSADFGGFGHYPAAFALFPFVIWGALRFGVRGAATITVVVALLSILATTQGTGPFVVESPEQSLIRWWTYITLVAIMGLLLGASGAQRKLAETSLKKAQEDLERRVEERTHDLAATNRALEREVAMRKGLEREVIRVSEDQATRLGQELHDGLGQHLTGVGFLSQALAEQLSDHVPELCPAAQEIVRLIDDAISITRSVAKGLCPAILESGGLVAALGELAKQTRQQCRIQCVADCQISTPGLDRITVINLYRIAQEATNNAIRHGHATRVAIEFAATHEGYRLVVSDNGVGFDPHAMTDVAGLGHHIMRYRAGMMGASLTVHSRTDGGGTQVSVVGGPPRGGPW